MTAAAQGLAPLTESQELMRAAAAYSQRMVAEAFFGHDSPDGGTLVDRLRAVGYLGGAPWAVGENIAWGQGSLSTPRAMVAAWMNSAGHRENVLGADYREIGLGIALGAPPSPEWGATYTTDFGWREAGAIETTPVRPTQRRAVARRPARQRKTAVSRSRCGSAAAARRHGKAAEKRRARACAGPHLVHRMSR
jgi:Cysteine-rich secretory protein family